MPKYVAKNIWTIKYVREFRRLSKPILRANFKQHNEIYQMRTTLLSPQSILYSIHL